MAVASTSLLVIDRRALDLTRVRRAARARGWTVALEGLDGGPAPRDGSGWFPDILRLRVSALPGGPQPDASALLTASAGLALDDTRARPVPPHAR